MSEERLVKIAKNGLQMWSHLLKKSLMGNFIFCAVLECAKTNHKIFFNTLQKSHRIKNLAITKE